MKIKWTKIFFSTLQLTCNIRQFRKLHFKMLKNHQDNVFFCQPLQIWVVQKFEKSWCKKFAFHTLSYSCTSFCTRPMQCKVFFYKIPCCITLQCVLCYITLHYKFNSQHFIYRSKLHAQKVCLSLTRNNGFFTWR